MLQVMISSLVEVEGVCQVKTVIDRRWGWEGESNIKKHNDVICERPHIIEQYTKFIRLLPIFGYYLYGL